MNIHHRGGCWPSVFLQSIQVTQMGGGKGGMMDRVRIKEWS